eukprot:6184441-Pleurochrysis_carterae.AAC.1
MGTRAPHAEHFIKKEASHKHVVFLLNKARCASAAKEGPETAARTCTCRARRGGRERSEKGEGETQTSAASAIQLVRVIPRKQGRARR